jgi:hypothetical protein
MSGAGDCAWAEPLGFFSSDAINDIVVGRAPLSVLDGPVTAWRNNGGDQAWAEYQEAIAGAKYGCLLHEGIPSGWVRLLREWDEENQRGGLGNPRARSPMMFF